MERQDIYIHVTGAFLGLRLLGNWLCQQCQMKVHWGLVCWQSLGFKALVKLNFSSSPWIFLINFPSLSIFAGACFKRFILLATKSAFNKKRREILGAGSKFERLTIMVKHLRVERKASLLFIPFKVLWIWLHVSPPRSSLSSWCPLSSSEDPLFRGFHLPCQFRFQSHLSTLSKFCFHLHTMPCIPQGCGTVWLYRS